MMQFIIKKKSKFNMLIILAFVSVVLGLLLKFLVFASATKYPISDHYDGAVFFMPDKRIGTKSLWSVLKWKWTTKKKKWPAIIQDNVSHQVQEPLPENFFRVTMVNHASFLLQWKGKNIITDPVFSDGIGPFSMNWVKRHRLPGVTIADLPKIDYILLSHNHYDHLDERSIQAIIAKGCPKIFGPLGIQEDLKFVRDCPVKEMDWWDEEVLGDFKITFVPAAHWSKRWLWDTNRSLWGGFVIQNKNTKVYFSGDTGYHATFKNIYEKFGAMTLSLLPIGAYEPRWFMQEMHMDPQEAVQAHKELHSERSIGMHFGTFDLANEYIDDPEQSLKLHFESMNVDANDFVIPKNGQSYLFQEKE